MPGHFSSIGIPIESEEDIATIGQSVDSALVQHPCSDGCYHSWTSDCGAQLWIQTDKESRVLGMNPHFAGPARMKVRLTAYIPSTTPSILDGSYHGWADPPDGAGEGAYPFVFDAPDASLHRTISLPAIVEVQLAAFAHELQVHENEETYYAAQPADGLKMAAESFIPSGLFGQREGTTALGMFVGRVFDASHKTNPLRGLSYWWALVQTLGGRFDVVIDPSLVTSPIKPGNIVQGSFWLSGIIQTQPAGARPGFWKRMFKKQS